MSLIALSIFYCVKEKEEFQIWKAIFSSAPSHFKYSSKEVPRIRMKFVFFFNVSLIMFLPS